ncbi:hypothetical protein ABTN50_20015, partial [Acinetobacter baumannii]
HPMAGSRRSLLRRHSQSKIIAIAEHGLALVFAVTVVTAMVDPMYALIPLAFAGLVLWLFAPGGPSWRWKRGAPAALPVATALQ